MKLFKNKLDYISIIYIILNFVLMMLNWDKILKCWDTPYHLLMGKMYSDFKTITVWDYYEYAPVGRPQLYPPFLHILIWFIHDITFLDYISIGRLIVILQYPLSLFSIWFAMKSLFGSREAFFSTIFLSLNIPFFSWMNTVAPTALLSIIYPLLALYFYKKNIFLSTMMLTISLYSHLGIPYIFILSIIIFTFLAGIGGKKYFKELGLTLGLSALLFTPWIYRLYVFRDWIKFERAMPKPLQFVLPEVNLILLPLLIVGVAISIIKMRRDIKYSLLLAGFIGFIPIFYTYQLRYYLHSPIVNSMVEAVGFSTIIFFFKKWVSKKKLSIIAILICLLLTIIPQPIISFHMFRPPPRRGFISLTPTPLLINIYSLGKPVKPEGSIFEDLFNYRQSYLVAEWIRENVDEDEIIHVPRGMMADFITLTTGRLTDGGMYGEVRSEEMLREIIMHRKSGIFVFEENIFRRYISRSPRIYFEVLAVFRPFIIVRIYPKVVKQIDIRLKVFYVLIKNLSMIPIWNNIILNINPEKVVIALPQQYLNLKSIYNWIKFLYRNGISVGIAVVPVDQKNILNQISELVSNVNIDSIRIMGSINMLNPYLLKNVRDIIGGRILEIGLIGRPLMLSDKAKLDKIKMYADIIVRHIPPSIDYILYGAEKECKIIDIPKENFFIQIDLESAKQPISIHELEILLTVMVNNFGERIILEYSRPPRMGMIEYLKEIYG